MRGIDFIATAAAVGVFGYFVYKVILPKLGDIQLPFWQPPVQTQQEQPVQYQQPAATDQVPPAQPIEQDPESKKPKEEDQPKSLVPSRSPPSAVAAATPPPPSQPSAGGTLLYDSNTMGKWNSGKRTGLKKDGGQGPNGKGFATAASGNPTVDIDGNGIAHLTSSDLGRMYIYVNNYNARLEGNFMFEVHHGAADNISIKIRSRHNHSGRTLKGGSGEPCGGVGVAFHPDGEVEFAAESAHGTNPKMGSGRAPAFTIGKWYKFAFSVWDDGSGVSSKAEIDGKVVGTGKWASPNVQCHTKALFDTDSYFWIRLNSYGGTAKIALSNLKMYDLGSGTAAVRRLMIDEPYLFNGYYGRRRL